MSEIVKKKWTNSEIQKLFKMSIKSRHTLIQAEERGEIPKARREKRGSTNVRVWGIEQLPLIGKKYGFLGSPLKQVVICIYTPKGGVLKTGVTGNIARVIALNGLRVLVMGLDFQKSITNYLLPIPGFKSLKEMREYVNKHRRKGLYHFLYEDVDFEKVVMKTDIPTLDIIPETPDLIALEKALRSENRREYIFADIIGEFFGEYDVVVMDNAPAWSLLTECSLTACNNLISPLGCDFETLQALGENFIHINDFRKKMKLDWDNQLIVPTLLENNNVSQDVYSTYLEEFGDMVLPFSIRRTVKGQEARIANLSAIEYDNKSDLAGDYYEMTRALWDRVITAQEKVSNHA